MEIRFKDRKFVTTAAKMSLSKNAFFLIKDDVEGDIRINVALAIDSDSNDNYTRYTVENSYQALIQIYNAPVGKYVRTREAMKLGTYMNKYNLYLQFCLEPEDGNKTRVLKVTFYIEKKD